MNLNLTGHHLDITPAIRDYVVAKLERVTRHFDHVIDVNVVLSVDKLRQKVEVNVHVRGKDIHAESDRRRHVRGDRRARRQARPAGAQVQGEADRAPRRRRRDRARRGGRSADSVA